MSIREYLVPRSSASRAILVHNPFAKNGPCRICDNNKEIQYVCPPCRKALLQIADEIRTVPCGTLRKSKLLGAWVECANRYLPSDRCFECYFCAKIRRKIFAERIKRYQLISQQCTNEAFVSSKFEYLATELAKPSVNSWWHAMKSSACFIQVIREGVHNREASRVNRALEQKKAEEKQVAFMNDGGFVLQIEKNKHINSLFFFLKSKRGVSILSMLGAAMNSNTIRPSPPRAAPSVLPPPAVVAEPTPCLSRSCSQGAFVKHFNLSTVATQEDAAPPVLSAGRPGDVALASPPPVHSNDCLVTPGALSDDSDPGDNIPLIGLVVPSDSTKLNIQDPHVSNPDSQTTYRKHPNSRRIHSKKRRVTMESALDFPSAGANLPAPRRSARLSAPTAPSL